jgi:predicted GH43/DUF377 family glycosyl hydrolase
MTMPDKPRITVPGISARRVSDAPIVAAGSVPGYQAIFNAGAVHHDGSFHLFARGVRDGYFRNPGLGARFLDYVSDVLVFTSENGHDYRFQQVLARSRDSGVHSYEDARVQGVRDADGDGDGDSERIVMTYTNLPEPESGKPWQIGVHRLAYADGCFALNRTSGRVIGPDGQPDKDAVIFNLRDGRIAMIHRIHPNMQLAVFDSLDELWSSGDDYWDAHMANLDAHTIITPPPGSLGIGAGAPPVETDAGLLLFYHERHASGEYTANVALLDADTGRVKSLLAEPIPRPDGTIYLTYGAADRCVGAATVVTADVVAALRAAC